MPAHDDEKPKDGLERVGPTDPLLLAAVRAHLADTARERTIAAFGGIAGLRGPQPGDQIH